MNNHPFFSIVVPTYNRAHLIGDTISSILHQTFRDFELIIVDDGSKDNTRLVLQDWATKDQRIRYIHQENKERGAARNNGFNSALGDYVLFFDSDDEMKEDHLETLKKGIETKPQFDLFATKYAFKEGDRVSPSPLDNFKEGSYDIRSVLKGNVFGTLYCVRKDATGIELFPEDRDLAIMEDWIFLIYNLIKKPLYLIDKITIYINNHDDRSMSQNELVIRRKIKATELVGETVALTDEQRKLLWAYTYYFCGVHAYLDFNTKKALDFAKKAIGILGWKKEFIGLYVKSIIGKKNIERIKRLKK